MSAFKPSGAISTAFLSPSSPARYVFLETSMTTTVANGDLVRFWYPYTSGRIVDMGVYQYATGNGTSYTLDVRNGSSTSILTTLPVMTAASGASIVTDAKGELTLPAGWTRPVVKTDATAVVTKGSRLTISSIETGTYTTHAIFGAWLVFEPLS